MRLIYAPSLREKTDILHANCLVSYDIQILETLLSLNNGGGGGQAPLCKQTPQEIIYNPHKNKPKN
ncbi:MAG: hypothetical protein SOW25_06505 [Helicobacter sp.]|nr:hypothetical protein [Helicobacter sp.]